jgi:hypothetical protein
VAVPTPINQDRLRPLAVTGASSILGRNLTRGSFVGYDRRYIRA